MKYHRLFSSPFLFLVNLASFPSRVTPFMVTVPLLIAGAVATTEKAWAEPLSGRFLLAQQVVDGLPPPPPFVTFGEMPNLEQAPAFSGAPGGAQTGVFQPATGSATTPSDRYLVIVNGASPLLLAQVRQVEATAFLQNIDGQQIIQAGAFDDPSRAEQQVGTLKSQGIGAEVVRIPSSMGGSNTPQAVTLAANSPLPPPDLLPVVAVPREVVFGQDPANLPPAPEIQLAQAGATSAATPYYVVIPGRRGQLVEITNQVRRLGGGLGVGGAIAERERPLGPHVLVGPYANYGSASRWSRYFRDFGMDARVYYRR